jgi:hypothetical protein
MDGRPLDQEAWRTSYLATPAVTIYVPQSAVNEVLVSSSPSQQARLNGLSGGARVIRVADAPETPDFTAALADDANNDARTALFSGSFGREDAFIVHTAREMSLPLITLNTSMPNQIRSNVLRRRLWGGVEIRTPS